ncbi:D-alanyl-D-alanine carboxypeptidase/D-alanyl-D-alanine-endopeptidase (penicillin-binding protein 4) [Streptacidiphilus sp. BW17]|uniref:D-alanyl-D-alanine carboxypeptidase/D-alanyl-D-alanine endopeptidase n=1 Tax=Streptacidiphilus sp. BW17 TaxID=3156274 RepID=UPI003512A3CC
MSLTARPWRRWATALTAALVTALTTAAGGPAAAHRDAALSPDIEAIMHKPAYAHAQWGLLEIDDQTGRVIHSQYPDQMFVPGSTAKLVAVSGALHVLGADYRFSTPVRQLGTRHGSTLDGALSLVAKGDLTMGGRTRPDGTVDYRPVDHTYANDVPGAQLTPEDPLAGIDQIAQQVRHSGITHVQGNVVVDNRLFTTFPAFDPAPDPLIINDNVIDLLSTATTPGHAAKLLWRPQVAPYQVTSSVRTVAAGGTTNIAVTASPDGTRIHLSGTIAAGSQPQLRISNIQNPAAFGRTALIEALRRAGVTVSAAPTGPNPVRLLPGSYSGPTVAAYVSPVFSQYVKLIFKVSHNLGANLAVCLQAVSAHSHQCGDGFPVLHRFLVQAGIDPMQFQLLDGRGGNPTDRVTPKGINEILHYWLHTPDAKVFRDALPLLGVNGGLADVCLGSPTCPGKGKVWGKTGVTATEDALNTQIAEGGLAIGGYMEVCAGHYYTYYLVMNGGATPDINGVIDGINDLGRIAGLLQEQAAGGH